MLPFWHDTHFRHVWHALRACNMRLPCLPEPPRTPISTLPHRGVCLVAWAGTQGDDFVLDINLLLNPIACVACVSFWCRSVLKQGRHALLPFPSHTPSLLLVVYIVCVFIQALWGWKNFLAGDRSSCVAFLPGNYWTGTGTPPNNPLFLLCWLVLLLSPVCAILFLFSHHYC